MITNIKRDMEEDVIETLKDKEARGICNDEELDRIIQEEVIHRMIQNIVSGIELQGVIIVEVNSNYSHDTVELVLINKNLNSFARNIHLSFDEIRRINEASDILVNECVA